VADLDAAERDVPAIGAALLERGPADRPFCLVRGPVEG
jgi:hypothetical protein